MEEGGGQAKYAKKYFWLYLMLNNTYVIELAKGPVTCYNHDGSEDYSEVKIIIRRLLKCRRLQKNIKKHSKWNCLLSDSVQLNQDKEYLVKTKMGKKYFQAPAV